MPLLKFIGDYNGERETLKVGPFLFIGREPLEVDPADPIGRRLLKNPDFTHADPLDHDGDGKKGGSPKGENATASKTRRRKAST